MDEHVEEIVLNDLDKGIAAFWHSVLDHTSEFLARVRTCPLTIPEWKKQRAVYLAKDTDDLDLGFATFYLNRTNRSGILNARPIGGLDQAGQWTIAARFNRSDLANRIERIGRYRNRIAVQERDGIDLLAESNSDANSFYYIDPPYLSKGSDLYLDELTWNDHVRLAKLLKIRNEPWILTYDADSRVLSELYPGNRVASFGIAHTAAKQGVGTEYAIFAEGLELPSLNLLGWSPQMIDRS